MHSAMFKDVMISEYLHQMLDHVYADDGRGATHARQVIGEHAFFEAESVDQHSCHAGRGREA